MGVYVNDLNLHDSSRELILAGTQQSAELQLALDQVRTESFVSRDRASYKQSRFLFNQSQTSGQFEVVHIAL